MNVYKYLDKHMDITKIQELKGDEYELALVRYVLLKISKLFYRSIIFFLNDEQIEQRNFIYSQKMNPENITSFEIVCSSYCSIIKEILKNKYHIEVELIETDRDVFKHVALLLHTKMGNRYFIDPLMDLSEMKAGMRTHNFASKEKSDNPYIRVDIENLNFLDSKILENIDDKIGYKKHHMYMDEMLDVLKNKLSDFEQIPDAKTKKKVAKHILKRPVKEIEYKDILNFKIIAFAELVRKNITFIGLVDFMIFVQSALEKILTYEEKDKTKISDFFVDTCDLKDENICEFLNSNENRKRGMMIKYNNQCMILSAENTDYLLFTQDEWEKIKNRNHIFIRKKEYIQSYKYLSTLELEPNILDHREFLKIFSKIERRMIKDNKQPKDYIDIVNRQKIIVNYKFSIEFSIENNLLVVLNKKNGKKYAIHYEDEGRNVTYKLI